MSPGGAAAFASAEIRPVLLVELQFESGTVRLHTELGKLTALGEDWDGCGALGRILEMEETAESRAVGAQLELAGLPVVSVIDGEEINIVAIASAEVWQHRPAIIYYGLLGAGRTWAVEPFQIRKAMMDQMPITDDGKTAVIRLTLESPFFDSERAEVTRYTAEQQRALYPGDKGCDQVAALQEKDITWNFN